MLLEHFGSRHFEILQRLAPLVLGVLDDTCHAVSIPRSNGTINPHQRGHTQVGVTRKLGGPAHKRAVLELARRDGPAADGAHDTRVRQLRLAVDDAVRDEVVEVLNGSVCLIHIPTKEKKTGNAPRCTRPA